MKDEEKFIFNIQQIEDSIFRDLMRNLLIGITVLITIIIALDTFLNGFIFPNWLNRLIFVGAVGISFYFYKKDHLQFLGLTLSLSSAIAIAIASIIRWEPTIQMQFFFFFLPVFLAVTLSNRKWMYGIFIFSYACFLFLIRRVFVSGLEQNAIVIGVSFSCYSLFFLWAFKKYKDAYFSIKSGVRAQSAVLEKSLQESQISQTQLESVFEHSPQALLLMRLDTIQLEMINQKTCNLFGFTRERIEKEFPSVFFENNPHFVDYAFINKNKHEFENYINGKPLQFETEVCHSSGEVIPCELHLLQFNIGDIPYVRASAIDLREQKVQQATERKQSTIIERIKDAVVVYDNNLLITDCNPAVEFVYGWKREELIGRFVLDIYSKNGNLEQVQDGMVTSIREGVWQAEVVHYKKNGHPIDVDVTIFMNFDGNKQPKEYITIAKDITDKKRKKLARTTLDRVEDLGLLAGGIAHDFNNLLGAILLESSLADRVLEPDHQARRSIEHITDITERAGHVVNKMLAYSGQGQSSVTQFQVNDLVGENLRDMQATFPPTIQLGLRLSDELKLTTGDEDQVNQTMRNLMQNSIDAIGDTVGRIDIQTRYEFVSAEYEPFWQFSGTPVQEGFYNVLHIIDSGIGIGDDELEKIFDPFFSTKLENQGLGLSAVLGIMLGHKGGIRVYSKPNIGSKFSLYFPATEMPLEEESESEDNRPLANITQKVLVIDDDEDVQTAVAATLELFNIPHIKASGGQEGIDLYKQHQKEIGLVFLDMKMPDIDGDAVYQTIRDIDTQVKVLVSSGFHESEIMPLFVGSSDTVSFIPKPFNINALINAMRDALLA